MRCLFLFFVVSVSVLGCRPNETGLYFDHDTNEARLNGKVLTEDEFSAVWENPENRDLPVTVLRDSAVYEEMKLGDLSDGLGDAISSWLSSSEPE